MTTKLKEESVKQLLEMCTFIKMAVLPKVESLLALTLFYFPYFSLLLLCSSPPFHNCHKFSFSSPLSSSVSDIPLIWIDRTSGKSATLLAALQLKNKKHTHIHSLTLWPPYYFEILSRYDTTRQSARCQHKFKYLTALLFTLWLACSCALRLPGVAGLCNGSSPETCKSYI